MLFSGTESRLMLSCMSTQRNAISCGSFALSILQSDLPDGQKNCARENLSSRQSENIPLRDCPKSHLHFLRPGPQATVLK
jgi:hypothetical protein